MPKSKTEPTGPITKAEALAMIAKQLRNPGLEVNHLLKLVALQAKIAGWDKKEDKPTEETNINKLVRELERKRKESQ